jgi:hypothetical protein
VGGTVESQDVGRDLTEEQAVVGDKDDRALEVEQALLQHFESGDVEVVGGLVKQQQVGGLQHQPSDQGTGLLAAGKATDRRLELLGAEPEAPHPCGDVDRAVAVEHFVGFRRQGAP